MLMYDWVLYNRIIYCVLFGNVGGVNGNGNGNNNGVSTAGQYIHPVPASYHVVSCTILLSFFNDEN